MTEGVTGPLQGLKVLDLSRILAGPWSSQALGDLGADVLKIEQPGVGDDTRSFGPPFLEEGEQPFDAAYFQCANRNKRGLAIDMAQPAGADLIQRMAAQCDIVVENFRVGGLARYGLDYASLSAINPALIYCSITGFGQTGPYAHRGGYDLLVQGMSGLMSITGHPDGEPGGGPLKTGVAVSDLFTGLYATISILAALRHRDQTGQGQHIDCALLDSQMAVLANQASNYLVGGVTAGRLGNEHPSLAPYRPFSTADGDVLVAVGNDRQFRLLCAILGREDLGEDPRFAGMVARVGNRAALGQVLAPLISTWTSEDFVAAMEKAGVPGGPINRIDQAIESPQIKARGLVKTLRRDDGIEVKVLGFPAQFSVTPPTYRRAPPRLGADTAEVLKEMLDLGDAEIAELRSGGVIPHAKSSGDGSGHG